MYNVSIECNPLHKKNSMRTYFEKKCPICTKIYMTIDKRRKNCSFSCNGKSIWANKRKWRDLSSQEQFEYMKNSFYKKIIKKEGCWDWSVGRTGSGYGVIYLGRNQKLIHRVSWLIHHGEIPKELWVLHKCDNPICSNPDHLYLGTPQQNTNDKIARGRLNLKYGEDRSHSKLKNYQAKEIKEKLLKGIHEKELSKEYSVHVNTIRDIKMGRRWQFLLGG
jgi:hypothetical protein